MTSPPAVPPVGQQQPRVGHWPDYGTSSGKEAVELAAMAGLHLDPWEAFVLERSLGERDGKWAAFEVGVQVSRQNGKGAILEARELAGLFLLGERLIVHSAHMFDTSLEAFMRLLALIESTPDFDRRVQRVSRAHGSEGVTLKGGQRIRFRTRTKGGGRGFTGDCLILDEAMDISEMAHGALLPTLSARPDPQVWYTGSAVDQWVHDNGVVFARVRERGHKGEDGLAWFEWSLEAENPSALEKEVADSPGSWARANPALGIRISESHVANERRSMDARTFAVERLGVGDWPATDDSAGWEVIGEETWHRGRDPKSEAQNPVALAFDVTPDRSKSAIAAAGTRTDGKTHGEVVEHKRGTGWVVERLEELAEKHDPVAVVCDGSGPAASLLPLLDRTDIEVVVVTAKEHAQACGQFYDEVDDDSFRHLGDPDLADAVRGAKKRPLGEAWAWSRKSSSVDISPLVAVTLARWGLSQEQTEEAFVEVVA